MRFRAIPVRCRYLEVVCNVIAGAAPIDLTCGSVEHKNSVMNHPLTKLALLTAAARQQRVQTPETQRIT